MVKDVVCRMEVDPKTATFKSQYQGQTYYFCSKSDKDTFDKNPAKYAGARVLLEPFRGDSVAWTFGLRSMQVLALVVMTIAGALLARGLSAAHPPGLRREPSKNVV